MKTKMLRIAGFIVGLTCTDVLTSTTFAGQAMKWQEIPEAVRATILANGGKAGSVDKESEQKDGKAVYEASVKDKNGNVSDLVVTEDGKLVEIKHDDAADKAAEIAAKKSKKARKSASSPKFSHPKDIYNPYLPLSYLQEDILEGKEDGKTIRIERSFKPELHKTFKVGNQTVDTLVFVDKEFEDGQVSEVATDYFAQADDGTVYYLGEDVDTYKDGKVVAHEGAWLYGKDTQNLGVLFPGQPKAGDKFKSEDVSKEINEVDEVISTSETVNTPAGTYHDCIKVKENLADGSIEYKYYAPGVGVVREQPTSGDVLLKSHKTRK